MTGILLLCDINQSTQHSNNNSSSIGGGDNSGSNSGSHSIYRSLSDG